MANVTATVTTEQQQAVRPQIDVAAATDFLTKKYSRPDITVAVKHIFDRFFRINLWGLTGREYRIKAFEKITLTKLDGPVIIESYFVEMVKAGEQLDCIVK
jgi:hypothetical protein